MNERLLMLGIAVVTLSFIPRIIFDNKVFNLTYIGGLLIILILIIQSTLDELKIKDLFYDYLFKKIEFKTVLEVGSGNGKMIDYFTNRGKKVTGIDKYPTRKQIKKMDFLKNNFTENSYDLVYSAHTIEHISNNEKFAKELVRVSKKYVCVVAPLPGKRFWNQPDHIRPYTKETLKRIFHLREWIYCFEISLPFFEKVSIVLFQKKTL